MPRTSTITFEIQEQYRAMLSVGLSRRRAAHLLGFSESTIRNAMRRDEKFAIGVLRVERNREVLALRSVQDATAKSWRAGKWLLERINPNDYGPRRNERYEERMSKEIRQTSQTVTDTIMSEIKDPELRRKIGDKFARIRNGIEILGPWSESAPADDAEDSKLKRYHRLTWLESMAQVDDEETDPSNEPDTPWDGPHI